MISKIFMTATGLSVALLLSILLVSCGGAATSTEPPSTPTAPATVPTAAPPTGTHTVAIDGHSLTLPNGFTISRLASGRDGLRMMALTDDGLLLVTEMGRGDVLGYRLSDANPQPVTVLKGLSSPSGIALHDKYLFIAETTRVTRFEYQGNGVVGAGQVIIPDLPAGGHETRTIGIGSDSMLYLTVGSSCNVCEETDPRRAAMSRYNIDGSNGQVIASGLRNAVGFTWHPVTGEIWATDNGRDNIGDDIPPDEVDIIKEGRNYGWPYCYGDRAVNPEFQDDNARAAYCAGTEPPAVDLQAHSAALGLRFLSDPTWPASYQNNLFIAFHGSWNRTIPTGYKVVRVDADRNVSDFITGWLDEKTGEAWGRPVDILFANNKMYITDDSSGSIYEVRYEG